MIPALIHFLDNPGSEAVEAKIRARIGRLTRFSGDIQKCEVWVRSPHGHHRKGDLYAVRIRLTVPDDEIAIELQPTRDDVHVAVRDAFDSAGRKLEDYERRRRGQVKAHPRGSRKASRRRRARADRERTSVREDTATF